MSDQDFINLANFYGIKILPPDATEHQFIDKNGNSVPLTLDKWASVLGLPYSNLYGFDEHNLSESILPSIQFVAIDKQAVFIFNSDNILERNTDIVEPTGNTQYAMAA
jgi:hypothetical protein